MVATEPAGRPLEPSALARSESSLDDWRLVLRTQSNALIEGDKAATERMLRFLRPYCVEPVVDWIDAHGDTRPATLIVREVENLSTIEQRRLLQWIEGGERPRVLSISSRPLFPLVAQGLFSEDLFYRLNVLRLDV